MNLQVHLFPPLNNTAGQAVVQLALRDDTTVQTVIDALIECYGPEMRKHLYDTRGRIIPAWCVFVNRNPVQLNDPDGLRVSLHDGDELTFLLNLAGG